MISFFYDNRGEPRIHGSTGYKSTWKQFRGWLFFGNGCCLNLEWSIAHVTPAIGFYVGTGDRPEITLRLGIPFLVSIWFTLEWTRLRFLVPTVKEKSFMRPGEFWDMEITRFTGIAVHDRKIWISLWADQDNETHNWKWQQFSVRFLPRRRNENAYRVVVADRRKP